MSKRREKGAPKRESGCPISFALGIFGDRWSLLVLRDLILKGRRRYKDLLAAEEGIATNILSDRLRRLEAHGLIVRAPDASDGRQFIYRPTPMAVDLIPMLVELVVWGARNDPGTTVPDEFIKQFENDREALIALIRAKLKAQGNV
ncbi:MAG: helix-turn-helix domain-containing protein [Wenzhouxiangellaceae bacterium]